MAYNKLFNTFPSSNNNLIKIDNNKLKKSSFTINHNINFINNKSNIQVTGSIKVNNDFKIKKDLNLKSEINLNGSFIKIVNNKINFDKDLRIIHENNGRVDFKDSIVSSDITGSILFIDDNSTQYFITGSKETGLEVKYDNSNKTFILNRKNNISSDSSEFVITCDPTSENNSDIIQNSLDWITHSLSANVTNENKYNIRNNLGDDLRFCTNTVIFKPGYNDLELRRKLFTGTKSTFIFKNLDVMPGWSTGSNDIIGNGDIAWPIVLDDDHKKASQTLLIDFSHLDFGLENRLEFKIEDDYLIESVMPLMMITSSDTGKYYFPSGSIPLDDNGSSIERNNLSFFLGSTQFHCKDVRPGGSLNGLNDPIYNTDSVNNFTFNDINNSAFSYVNGYDITNNSISLSTFKPRLIIVLKDKILRYENLKYFSQTHTSMSLTIDPVIVADYQLANDASFFSTNNFNFMTLTNSGRTSNFNSISSRNEDEIFTRGINYKIFPCRKNSNVLTGSNNIEHSKPSVQTDGVTYFTPSTTTHNKYNSSDRGEIQIKSRKEVCSILNPQFYSFLSNNNEFLRDYSILVKDSGSRQKTSKMFKNYLLVPYVGIKNISDNTPHLIDEVESLNDKNLYIINNNIENTSLNENFLSTFSVTTLKSMRGALQLNGNSNSAKKSVTSPLHGVNSYMGNGKLYRSDNSQLISDFNLSYNVNTDDLFLYNYGSTSIQDFGTFKFEGEDTDVQYSLNLFSRYQQRLLTTKALQQMSYTGNITSGKVFDFVSTSNIKNLVLYYGGSRLYYNGKVFTGAIVRISKSKSDYKELYQNDSSSSYLDDYIKFNTETNRIRSLDLKSSILTISNLGQNSLGEIEWTLI